MVGIPQGLRTQLGRTFGGAELSHGQWQRIALARGLMRETPLLLVLDEPTAALDQQAEHDLFELFAEQTRDSTGRGAITVLVSHRFSTVHMAESQAMRAILTPVIALDPYLKVSAKVAGDHGSGSGAVAAAVRQSAAAHDPGVR
ncbi:ATP-binding cassette domain-containing protein [Nonomuraea insulae]|uniref:ATP-binding cassette domain-containing protein n=1 Tax=Nonomuraea insulae TaxID=1616787 RepID=A0ABW1CVF5_9ACTN